MKYVLDACALIAFLGEERGKGFEAVDALFTNADVEKITIYISIVNLTEVFYHFIRDIGKGAADGEIKKPELAEGLSVLWITQ